VNCRPVGGIGAGNFILPASKFRRALRKARTVGSREYPMRIKRIEKRLSWPIIWLASAIAVIAAGCTDSDAGARKAALMKASVAPPQEKPVKLRYYGGPKYPRYPE
jgi:hypothetical protein